MEYRIRHAAPVARACHSPNRTILAESVAQLTPYFQNTSLYDQNPLTFAHYGHFYGVIQVASGILNVFSPKRTAAILLVAMLAWLGFQGWTAWKQLGSWQNPPPVRMIQPPAARTVEGEAIARVHLFGEPQAVTPEKSIPEDLPETRLRLTLRGVADGSDGREEGALIDGPDGRTEFYRLGETVTGGALLKDVREDSVVLDRKGKLEVLRFPETSETSGGFEVTAVAPDAADFGDDEDSGFSGSNDEQVPEEASDPDFSQGTAEVPMYSAPVIDEARREEIRAKLQQLREQIRAQSQQ
ncbi:type II secretion system protein N [Hahella sp. SMD15-11]|uniref:Type II secretion system protein N n=1 Tax=Thermohahella caldifontis TaxID=3142973 RepID=A0AB39UXV3_9GAMM